MKALSPEGDRLMRFDCIFRKCSEVMHLSSAFPRVDPRGFDFRAKRNSTKALRLGVWIHDKYPAPGGNLSNEVVNVDDDMMRMLSILLLGRGMTLISHHSDFVFIVRKFFLGNNKDLRCNMRYDWLHAPILPSLKIFTE